MMTNTKPDDHIHTVMQRLAVQDITPARLVAIYALPRGTAQLLGWIQLMGSLRTTDLCKLQRTSAATISRQVAPLIQDGRVQKHQVKTGAAGRPATLFTMPGIALPTCDELRQRDGLVEDILVLDPDLLISDPPSAEVTVMPVHPETGECSTLPTETWSDMPTPGDERPKDTETPENPSVPSIAARVSQTDMFDPAWADDSEAVTPIPSDVSVSLASLDRQDIESPPWSTLRQTSDHLVPQKKKVHHIPGWKVWRWGGLCLRSGIHVIRIVLSNSIAILGTCLRAFFRFVDDLNVATDGLLGLVFMCGVIGMGLFLVLSTIINSALPVQLHEQPPMHTELITPVPLPPGVNAQAQVVGTGQAGLIVRDAVEGRRIDLLADQSVVTIIDGPEIMPSQHPIWWQVAYGDDATGWVSGSFLIGIDDDS